MVEGSIPALAFSVSSGGQLLGTIGTDAFELNGARPSQLLATVALDAANLPQLQQQVTAVSKTNRVSVTVQGVPDSTCMSRRVLAKVQLPLSIPLSSDAPVATTRAAAAPLLSVTSLAVDRFDSSSFATRAGAALGFTLIGNLPNVSFVVTRESRVARLDATAVPGGSARSVTVDVRATVSGAWG